MKELHGLIQPLLQPVVFYGIDQEPCTDPFHDGFETERIDNGSHESCVTRFFPITTGQNTYRGRCQCQECWSRTRPGHWFVWFNNPENNHDIWTDVPIKDEHITCWNCFLNIHPTPEQGIPRTKTINQYTGPLLPYTEWREPTTNEFEGNDEPYEEELFDHVHCLHDPETNVGNGEMRCCECGFIQNRNAPEEGF